MSRSAGLRPAAATTWGVERRGETGGPPAKAPGRPAARTGSDRSQRTAAAERHRRRREETAVRAARRTSCGSWPRSWTSTTCARDTVPADDYPPDSIQRLPSREPRRDPRRPGRSTPTPVRRTAARTAAPSARGRPRRGGGVWRSSKRPVSLWRAFTTRASPYGVRKAACRPVPRVAGLFRHFWRHAVAHARRSQGIAGLVPTPAGVRSGSASILGVRSGSPSTLVTRSLASEQTQT